MWTAEKDDLKILTEHSWKPKDISGDSQNWLIWERLYEAGEKG